MSRKKILWLVSWYPNKLSPFNGDFIKRHAEAVSLYHDVQVIYVIRDAEGVITKNILIEESVKDGLAEKVVYYYNSPVGLSILDKYLSETKYRKLFKQAVVDYIDKSGIPALSHVHVGMKAGVIAQWFKKKNAVPYVISEHWSGFLPEADDMITDHPFYIKALWKKIIAGASSVSTVSHYLAEAVKKYTGFPQIHVIPNVVDTIIFYPTGLRENDLRFIHISGLEELKNVPAIIEAFVIVQKKYISATLTIVGPENKQLKALVNKLQLKENVLFCTEVPQQQLAELIRQSVALILYSRYETFGCVIIEANACGVPVIVSDIPVFHETVIEGLNGTFAKRNNPQSLAEKMIETITKKDSFDRSSIAATSLKYRYEKIGKQFSDWYEQVLLKL
jgi:glycosyltransferase involved in cell wall biosynthesis